MGATVESLPSRAQGLRSSALRRPLAFQARGCRVVVDADGSLRTYHSLEERRALFGHEQLRVYKVQAGVIVQAQRPDFAIRLSPRSVQLSGKLFDSIDIAQSIESYRGKSLGYVRRLRLRNGGQTGIRLRLLVVSDPTAAHFSGTPSAWGSLGVNAFNRESHVAMDEVSDPPSARVVGSAPSPSKFYMTTDRTRAQELLGSGELPEGTAGMSGQVLILSSHELELSPGEAKEIVFASIYNASKLEDALADFGRLQAGERQQQPPRPFIACSEQAVNESAAWAFSAIEAGAYADDSLERYEALKALHCVDPTVAARVIADARATMRKDGSLPHSMNGSKAGLLESSVFLQGYAAGLVLGQDKKAARAAYPFVKKLAGFLLGSSKDFTVTTDPSLPNGWRRHLGRGFPTGEIPEVSLAVAGALAAASQVARLVSKGDDAARFRERAEMICEHVRKKLLDERGFVSLCRDSAGRLRSDETVDMAVAAYRHHFMASAEQAAAHRLLEKDFDTQYGPRCVPNTNQVYFNSSYGWGQLGGVWTRAVLAYAMVCYRSGLSGMGSLALAKVARLVSDDAVRLGGTPGTFPLWVDVDGGEAHGDDSDPVSAARFVEAVLEGELGLAPASEKPSLSPAASSGLGWVLVSDLWLGEPSAVFLGRGGGKAHLFFSGSKLESKSGTRFAKFERLELSVKGVSGLCLHTPGQMICLANSTTSPVKLTVSFSPRDAELTKHLSTPLEVFDPSRGGWNRTGSIRVFPTMSFEASLEPSEWKIYRVSTP